MNVVVVAPHPDDEIIGVAGTMAKHSANGDDVDVVVVTTGVEPFYSEEYVKLGRNQQKEANRIIGTRDIHYLDLPTPILDTIPHVNLVKKIQEKIESLKPEVVYIPHYGDMHIEHRMIEEACMVALRPKKFEDLKIYAYEVPSETGWNVPAQHNEFIPNVYVKLSQEELDKKVKALEVFSSQMGDYPNTRSVKSVINLAEYRGNAVSVNAAEAFMLIREQRS